MNPFKTDKVSYNKVLFLLTASDIFTWGLVAIINALAGLYLENKLEGVSAVQIVGIGTGLYSLVNGSLQIPIGLFVDKIKSDKDDILVLFTGNLLMGLTFLLFPFIESQYFYFFLQMILGAGAAMNLVTWRKMFATNLDKNKEGMQYGVYQSIVSVCVAFFGVIAGSVAKLGASEFDTVMFAIGSVMMLSGIFILLIFKVQNRKIS